MSNARKNHKTLACADCAETFSAEYIIQELTPVPTSQKVCQMCAEQGYSHPELKTVEIEVEFWCDGDTCQIGGHASYTSCKVKPFRVSIDTQFGPYPAHDSERSWNGWECPLFSYETARLVLADMFGSGQPWRFDEETRTFHYEMEDGYEYEHGPVEICGVEYWEIGDGWCWEEWTEADDIWAARQNPMRTVNAVF